MHSSKPNLTSGLVEYLRDEITSGRILPGSKLPSENTLMELRSISRTVVREAITRLQAEGLVHTKRGAGSFALTPPPQQPPAGLKQAKTLPERLQLLEFRIGLESEAASLAATRINESNMLALDAALDSFAEAGTHAGRSLSCDFTFHLALAQASGNPYFSDAIAALGPAMIAMPRMRLELSRPAGTSRLALVQGEHQSIRDAVRAGNPQAASAAMRVHLTNSMLRLGQVARD